MGKVLWCRGVDGAACSSRALGIFCFIVSLERKYETQRRKSGPSINATGLKVYWLWPQTSDWATGSQRGA